MKPHGPKPDALPDCATLRSLASPIFHGLPAQVARSAFAHEPEQTASGGNFANQLSHAIRHLNFDSLCNAEKENG